MGMGIPKRGKYLNQDTESKTGMEEAGLRICLMLLRHKKQITEWPEGTWREGADNRWNVLKI